MRWLTSDWAPTWRHHHWVFLIWLLGSASLVAWIPAVFIGGFDSHPALVCMLGGIVLPFLHADIVQLYERRARRISERAD